MNIETYDEMFKRVHEKNEGAFVPFIVAGDPDFETSLEIVKTFVENGADALEIGFPFSDPVADGPTVQLADIRSLEAGMTVKKGFEFIKRVREFTNIPIGVLTYYNLIYKMGLDTYFKTAKESGVNAVLAADLPPEEAEDSLKASKANGVQQIFMAAQTTSNERLPKITEICSGFLYVVAVMGTTGVRSELKNTSFELIERVKANSDIPICVGFGISKPEHVREVITSGADGAIVASAILNIMTENLENKEIMLSKIASFCRELKEATKL
ncbi:MAG TPA: tryptophan synthase subunit alpha [Methanobacterium sp.]|nr:tryptophan synthase subunit alpha [Methanobacterium sp.]